jgi:hypothetical protein
MISNQEKIDILISRLNTLEFIKASFINHAEEFQNKYSLEEELESCNSQKNALLEELTKLGGVWTSP